MSTKKPLCVIFTLLLCIGIFTLPQSATNNVSAKITPQVASMQGPPDPPTTRLIREYQLPVVPFATVAYLGPARTPFDVAYDSNGYAWVTDIARDTIYRLTPATLANQTSTSALEWVLPNTDGKRSPLYIIANETQKVVWFTNPTSNQISRLNWSNNQLVDWDLSNLTIMPLDLVMQTSNVIWFTGLNNTGFFRLQVNTNLVTVYKMFSAVGGILPVRPTRITINATCLFLTDSVFDVLYEVALPAVANALIFPLTRPGFSWDVDVDSGNNVWVTQPLSSLIDEQLVHSVNKSYYQITPYQQAILTPDTHTLKPDTLNVGIQITSVTPKAFPGPLNVTGDPYAVWSIPTGVTAVTYVPPPARPWDVATSADGYAWFTEPLYNNIGAIQPGSPGTILLYLVPTSKSWPLSMDIQPGNPSSQYHVWFTEYLSGKIGELFNGTATDIRVCPSLPAQYPPPPPGSIRWTTSEIWVDAPSNGYNPSHHDSPERGVLNHLYARVTNLGPATVTNVTVKFYWYSNTSYSLDLNYIPLPPDTASASSWTFIGSTQILFSMPPGSTFDAPISWTIGADVPTNVTIGVQVSVAGESSLYDNIGYANFTLTTPGAPPTFTIPGVATGFFAGAVVMGLVIVVARASLGRSKKGGKH